MKIETLTSSEVGLKITDIKQAVKNPNRVNIFVNDKYDFSLDISQLTDAKLKIGQLLTEPELAKLHGLSDFGKLYIRTLEYALTRPRSVKETRDYLARKERARRTASRNVRESGFETRSDEVISRLIKKGYLDDAKFAAYLVENYHASKGSSRRRLEQELRKKGVDQITIDTALAKTTRDDQDEIQKIIAKKSSKYPDPQNLKTYLLRQGFSYDDISQALNSQ